MKKTQGRRDIFNIFLLVLSAVIFIFSSAFFIALHDLKTFKEPIFNIKDGFYVENQTEVDYLLRLQSPAFLKARIKYKSMEAVSVKSFSLNGVIFNPVKVRIKNNGASFYEYLIPRSVTREENKVAVMLSGPLCSDFKLNFKNNVKLNKRAYAVFQRPDFKTAFPQARPVVFAFLIFIYYLFVIRGADALRTFFQVSIFLLSCALLAASEWFFGFSLKSDRYLSLFMLTLIFGTVKHRKKIWFYAAVFLKGVLARSFDAKDRLLKAVLSRRSKTLFKNALFSSIGFLIIFSLLELLSFAAIKFYYVKKDNRVREYEYFMKTGKGFSKRNIASWVSHPFIPYVPDVNVRDENGLLFNSYGYRSKTVPHEKGIRVACLGCSTTFGWSVKTEEAWPSVLEDYLRGYFKRDDIDVINFGIPSAPSEVSLAVLHFKVLALRPDMVLILQGINDATHWPENGKRKSDFSDFALRADWPEKKLLNPVLLFMSHSNLFRLFLYVKASGSSGLDIIPYFDCWYDGVRRVPENENQSSYKLVPWQEIYARNMRSMIGICKVNNIDLCLLENMQRPGPSDVCVEINRVTKEIARDTGVDYIPLTHLSEDYFADPFHLNKEGEAQKAKEVFEFLTKNKGAVFRKPAH